MSKVILILEDTEQGVSATARFDRPMEAVDERPTPAEQAAASLMSSSVADMMIDERALVAPQPSPVIVP